MRFLILSSPRLRSRLPLEPRRDSGDEIRLTSVSDSSMIIVRPAASQPNLRTAILLAPGGGYGYLALHASRDVAA